jgi:hypothetical protein
MLRRHDGKPGRLLLFRCFYFKEEGALFVRANTPSYAVVIGKSDFSDAQNAIKLDHLVVNNASTSAAAGGLQLNYVLNSDIYAVADSAGGAAGIALEQTQFSRISGAGSAAGTGGAAMLLENGFNFANTIFGFDFEVAPTCLSITFNDGQNTFVSPYFNCATAISATASTRNLLTKRTHRRKGREGHAEDAMRFAAAQLPSRSSVLPRRPPR